MRSLIWLAACSCGEVAIGTGQQVTSNEGEVCLHADPELDVGEQVFEVGQPVHVEVRLDRCLSSSCDVDRAMSCTVDQLAITSVARWTNRAAPEGCTDDCGTLSATCETLPLPAGTHVFTFNGDTIALTVPSTTPEPLCVETD